MSSGPLATHSTAFVLLRYGLDAARYRAAFERGEVPDESPYGFHLAEALGWRVIFSVDHPEGRTTALLRRGLRRMLGFDLVHAWRNRPQLREADIAWTMTEYEWFALRCLGRIVPSAQRPVIGNSIWLFNAWEGTPAWRRWIARLLAMGPGVLTVHADPCLAVARRVLPNDAWVERMFFGIIPESGNGADAGTVPREGGPLRVLAMGNDATRDWTTFLRAFGNDPRFTVDLVCAGVSEELRSQYSNLLPVIPGASNEALSRADLRRRYAWSDVVVVPMVENLFSGITSAIDACGRGRPVISSRTGGVPTYFDEGEVIYVPPGDPDALRCAALLPAADLAAVARAGRARFRSSDYSSRGMMARYVALSREVLSPRP